MSDPRSTESARIRPSGSWYALPAAVVVAGAIATILLLVAAFERFSDVAHPSDGGVVSVVDDERLFVFADLPASWPGAFDGAGLCSLTPLGGGDAVRTGAPTARVTFDEGSRHWVRIGVVPASTPPGHYELACRGIRGGDLAVASTSGIEDGALLAVAGVGIAVVATLAALVLLIVLLVMRSRSKSRIQAAAYPGGYPPPYQSYAQQPYVQQSPSDQHHPGQPPPPA